MTPHHTNPEAERAVVGALLLTGDRCPDVRDRIGIDDFCDYGCRVVYRALLALWERGDPIDLTTVAASLRGRGELDAIGGLAYLVELTSGVTSDAHLTHHVGVVADAASLRRVHAHVAQIASNLGRVRIGVDSVPNCIANALNSLVNASPPSRQLGLVVECAADVQSKPIDWIWSGWLAGGKLTLLAGDPGLGKSLLACELAARMSSGAPWPLESAARAPGEVLIISAEDDPEDTIKPRLEAAGADCSRVHFVLGAADARGAAVPFVLGDHVQRLARLIEQHPNIRLVILDPLSAFLGCKLDSYNNAQVRAVLQPLADFARRFGVALLVVHHLNKNADGPAVHRFSGSLAFVAAARIGAVVAKDRNDPGRRLLVRAKSNLGRDAGGLAFRIEPTEANVPQIVWETTQITDDADAVLGTLGADANSATKLEEAKSWLEQELADGERAVKDIEQSAQADGIAWKTLGRAKKSLHVRATKRADGWYWSLPPAEAQEDHRESA